MLTLYPAFLTFDVLTVHVVSIWYFMPQ